MRRLLLLLLVPVICLPGLWAAGAGSHPDEATYLALGAELHERGEWLTPTLDGAPTFYKPPLFFWLQRICFGLFGLTLFAGRLPAALAAIGLALLTGRLARRVSARAPGEDADRAEVFAALLVASSFGVARFGKVAMIDAPFALALTAVAWGAWRAAEEKHLPSLLWCGVGSAAALLLKGPVGAVLGPALALVFVAWRSRALLLSRWTLFAIAAFALIGLPWFLWAWRHHGELFVERFVLDEHGGKFDQPWRVGGVAALFVWALALMLPWTALFLGALPRHRAQLRQPGVFLALAWLAVLLLAYAVPSAKHAHYLLPGVVPMALLIARAEPDRWARWATAALLGVVALGALLALRLSTGFSLSLAIAAATGHLGAAAVLLLRERGVESAAAAGVGAMLLAGVVLAGVAPPLLPEAAVSAARDRELYSYSVNSGVYWLSSGRRVHRAWTEEHLLEVTGQGAVAILEPRHRLALGERVKVVYGWSRLRRSVPPELLLDAWRAGDLSLLYEEMTLVCGAGAPGC